MGKAELPLHAPGTRLDRGYIGQSVPRPNAQRLLQGRGAYTDDLRFPRLAHAVFFRSPYAHAKIRKLDFSRALKSQGVIGIFSGRDVAQFCTPWVAVLGHLKGIKSPPQHAIAIERAKQHGVCVMALANAHHLCRIGQWAEQAVAEGLVSISFVNVISRSIVAPFGGSDARFGTNPCTIGIPLEAQAPFILDMATSGVAQGKVRVAHNKGEKLPPGLLLDDRGNPTIDARFGVVEPFGALTTFGLHKGYGLAVVCELLGGALSGGGTWHTTDRSKKRVLNGMLSILIDPRKLGTADVFAREARAFIEWVKQSPPAPGADRVRIAGDPERETRARRSREGIAVDATTWEEIHAAAAKVGVAAQAVDRLAKG